MTYQQIDDCLTPTERKINKLLNYMKVNANGYWDPMSKWNKFLYKLMKWWFHTDPFDAFIGWVSKLDDGCLYVVGEDYTLESAKAEAEKLKEAFNR